MDMKTGAKPIKSLLKGLDCLAAINLRDGLTVTDCALATKVPRSTVSRILENLTRTGYLTRDEKGVFRATSLLRTLGGPNDEDSHIRKIAGPELAALNKKLVWPVGLTAPTGLSMVARSTSDPRTPLSLCQFSSGYRLSMVCSASGQVYLAFLPKEIRQRLLDACAVNWEGAEAPAQSRKAFEAYLDAVGYSGFSYFKGLMDGESTICVPVTGRCALFGALGMKFITRAIKSDYLKEVVVPALQATASRIGAHLS